MHRFLRAPGYFVPVLGFFAVATPAAAAVGDWVAGENVRIRLIAAGVNADGTLDAALDIQLAPGWKTYWRTPGEAGVAPVLDFAGSENVRSAAAEFPPPESFDDGFSVSNVYHDEILLPLRVEIENPEKPVEIVLSADLGVCDRICIPVHLDTALLVPAGEADAAAARQIAEARARLPGTASPGSFAVDSVERSGGTDKRPEFRVIAVAPAGAELFVEGPEDWYPGAAREISREGNRAVYTLVIDRLGAQTPIAGAELRFTLAAEGRAVEQRMRLD
jgi:suppressor for copper-sensitivity B